MFATTKLLKQQYSKQMWVGRALQQPAAAAVAAVAAVLAAGVS
jgi:hypothetical protein